MPTIVERPEQPYVAVRGSVSMQSINEIADRFPEVFGWLGAQGIPPAGAPFLRYRVIDMAGTLDIEAGVPVATTPTPSGEITAGTLPAGRYAVLTHIGHPAELVNRTTELLTWAADQGLHWDMSEEPNGEHWTCRLETYHTDPSVEQDLNKWETDLAFKLAD